ncbi:aminoacrylate hydrolase [Pseudaminobacter salicylatoxidans]|uniref:Aminoacrylate hydrolase n=1 Tax=Pseudaminobacter salicylatoxidans TaxID=93369 RepID=A0A316BJP7_PSESE|nr:aminoacrylate hydrolase [Pseudaminobacter salicylatoxidans]
MPFVNIRNGQLYYEEAGQGSPLLLIPGLGGVGSFWKKQVEFFQNHFRVIIHDHRGTGRSMAETERFSVDLMADDVEALITQLDLSDIQIIGHSTGGAIAQALAIRQKYDLRKLVLSATWAYGDDYFRTLFGTRLQILEKIGMHAYEQFGRIVRYPPSFLGKNPEFLQPSGNNESGDAPTIASRIQALLDFDSRNQLARIDVDTLLIGAIDDAVTPHHLWDELAEGIQGARMVKLPEGGHFCPQTASDAYNTHVMNFLQGRG